jgi:HEAT repeat protein
MLFPSALPRTLEASFRDLGSDKPATRASAVRDVVRHALRSDATRARAIPMLERVLKSDDAPAVRSAAAVALADVCGSEALPVLLVAIEDADPAVRQMALAALGEIGDRRAAQRLVRALSDPRPEVRYQAVIAYARVLRHDPHAVADALARAAADPDDAIRYIAMRVAEEELGPEILPCEGNLASQADILVGDPNAAVGVAAALYLARHGRVRGLQVVVDVIAENVHTPEFEDEQACLDLAGELRLTEAVAHLERRVWGTRSALRRLVFWGARDAKSCAWHARTALARLNHARARAEIVADIESIRREKREAAVVAAGRARLAEARAALERVRDLVDGQLVGEALARIEGDPATSQGS